MNALVIWSDSDHPSFLGSHRL